MHSKPNSNSWRPSVRIWRFEITPRSLCVGLGLIGFLWMGSGATAGLPPLRGAGTDLGGHAKLLSEPLTADAENSPPQQARPQTNPQQKASPQKLPQPSAAPAQGKPQVSPTGKTEQGQPLPSSPQQPEATPQPSSAGAPPKGAGSQAAPSGQLPQQGPAQPAGVTFRLENADLLQFVNVVATQLKMNYIVDPAVKGTVTITTSGELRREDLFPILQSVLRINGATAIQTGDFYRIVTLAQAPKTPLEVSTDTTGKTIPKDDRMMMQILPLRFVFASDMAKMLAPFLTDAGTVAVHEAGNILILVDGSLNVKRLMDILEQFDSATFAQQRIQLLPVHNNVASGLLPELESIFSAYALSEKSTPLRFIAVDRINSILVVTAEPSAFEEVEKWVQKLDQPAPPSGIQTFVYRVQNSEADYLAKLLTSMQTRGGGASITSGTGTGGVSGSTGGGATGTSREVGAFGTEVESGQTLKEGVRITTDPVNNSLLIQCTAQQYAEIVKTLTELDIIPRQVMIEARVYEVTLSGALSFGLSYFLQQRSAEERKPLASFTPKDALQASAGTLVGHTRELLAFLSASENRSRVQVLSAPTVLAMDNSDAKIQVGSEIPILTSQGIIPGVQAGQGSVFANTVQNRDTGIILTVTPRITSTGMVSLRISQEISSAQPPPAGSIQSPSFLKRSISTRAVVADGETIALGGLIQESVTATRNRIPLLGDIPGLGVLFGSTSHIRAKTELIVLLTPRIIKSAEVARDATRELREGLRDLRRSFRKDKFVNP
jgi:general secretion pathway protein D